MENPNTIENEFQKKYNEQNNIIDKVKEYYSKNLFIITKELEIDLPNILSYIQNYENEIINKINIIKYLNSLIQNIPYNLDLILSKTSENENQRLNLYEILINEYIFTEKEEKDYIQLLEDLINFIFKRLSFNKNIYRYILSFVNNFLNDKNHNEKNNKYYFNEYNYYNLLELIRLFYLSIEDEDPINYFYFNGDKNSFININNKENLLNLDKDLYILLFVKIIDYKYICSINQNNKEKVIEPSIIQIKFKDNKNNINININYKETFENKKGNDNLNIIDIPYNTFNLKETNNILVIITKDLKIQIYINGNEFSIPINQIKENNKDDNKKIESIQLFKEFFGICSTIMLYKNSDKNKLDYLFPKYLIGNKNNVEKEIIRDYRDGIFKEELLIPFIKADLKSKIEEKNIFDDTINNLYEESLNELQKFINYNLLSIYIPTRTYINSYLETKKEEKKSIDIEIKEIILVDSINNLNAILENSNLYPNLTYSRSGGVHLVSNILNNFSIDFGGINHLLPLIEVMTDYNELLTNKNLEKFMNILNLFYNQKNLLSTEENTKFFYYLSLFLEKIPEKFYNDVSVHIKSILLTLESLENESLSNNDDNIFKIYKQEFFDNICLNEKILFRFNYKDKSLMYNEIYKFLVKENMENKNIDIDMDKIINILLYHEKDKYTHFCCKKHASYFNKESKIMEPELNEYIKPLMNIIKLLLNQFKSDVNYIGINDSNLKTRDQLLKLFGILTFDITPCLQIGILKLFFEFTLINEEKYYNYLNVNNYINLITLFVYKTSVFDVKELAFEFLVGILNNNLNKNNNLEQYIEKYATYFYFPNDKEEGQDTPNDENIKKSFEINGIKYNLQEFTSNQKQLLSSYNKKNFNELMKAIFNKAESFYKGKISAKMNFNILINIVSKGDINFIIKFLDLLYEEFKNNNNDIEQCKIMYNSKRLLQWLLDTCFHSYLIKQSIINKYKIIPAFSFGEINEEKEKEKIIDKIILLASNLLFEFFFKNVFLLDYLLTWSKYYFELKEDRNKFFLCRKFIFEYFFEKLINRYLDKIYIKDLKYSNIFTPINKLYFINIIFEFLSFHKVTGFQSGGILKDLESLNSQVCIPFIYSFISELKNLKNEETLFLNEKWEEYPKIKKLMENLYFLGLEKEENKFVDEKNIYDAFINKKHNMFINELKIYSYNLQNLEILRKNQDFFVNTGIELIILKYHYYTLLLTAITNQIEFKEKLIDFCNFIVLIIVASTTLNIDNSKITHNNNIKSNTIWPTEEDYKNIQQIVKIILFNFFLFLKEKILEMINKIKRYETSENDEEKELFENCHLIKKYLILALFFFFKILYTIFADLRKQEIERKNSSGFMKSMLNKIKSKIRSEKEGIALTGGYKFIKEFIDNSIIELNQNTNETQSSNSSENDAMIYEKIFFEDIPTFTLNDINSKDFISNPLITKLEALYSNNIEKNENISKYFSDFKEKYIRKLFPFVNFILKRSKLIGNIIPAYNMNIYISSIYNNSLCLKTNYLPELSKTYINMENIVKLNKNLVDEIRRNQITNKFNEHNKIREYRKIKKQIFSFNGILSNKNYFYDKNKYICKYKLLNHMTEDFTRLLLTPIIDIDYYLPKFSKFELKDLFRNENKDHLIQISKIADLSLKEIKIEENKKEDITKISSLNGLYLIKESEYNEINEISNDIEGTLNHYHFYKKLIDKKHLISNNSHNCIEDSCLIKTAYHIRGFYYNNSEEIGFYSYDKIPYQYNKKSKNENSNNNNEINLKIKEIQKDYDPEREACFGSVFSPQEKKYEYMHIKIPYNKIVLILRRRYYFKVSALEIFTTEKKSYLFKFDHNKLNDIILKLKHYMNKLEDIYIENGKFYNKIGFLNLNSKMNNMNKKIYEKNYMNLKNLYEQWKKWEISTLQLLMLINIYANRSYNDINQYPVFPWIITDYISDKIPKINDEKFIRPLGTPIGMLEINNDSIQRKQDYLDHWAISKDDEDREDEYDRYGSHYSTSLYVTYYLVRIFPFAYIRIELQGSSFDDPNRLFNSLKTSFECSSTQKSDVRELIPELFYLPEIFLNNNDFNLGEVRASSKDINNPKAINFKKIDEVETPQWCYNNAYLFVKKHRELLECYEISKTLNKWINLIFGSKQKGAEANKIHNLYNRQTYEDFEKIFDEMSAEDKEITCRMVEFGVTPHQIFKSDTSQRKINLDRNIKNKLFFKTLENLKKNDGNGLEIRIDEYIVFEEIKEEFNFNSAQKIYYFPIDKNTDNIKKYIYIMNNNICDIYLRKKDKEIIYKENSKDEQTQELVNPYYGEEIGNDIYDEVAIKTIEKKESFKLTNFKYENVYRQPLFWIDNGRILVKGGYWNGHILLKNFNKEKDKGDYKINEEIHKLFIYTTSEYSPITKIIIDKNETFAICGNTNGTIFIFKINSLNKLKWSLYKNFNNHNSPIKSMAIHENLNILITCSADGLCMLYTLPYFKLYNSFIIGKDDKENEKKEILTPDIVLISDKPLPCFIFYIELKRTIYFYSINGCLLKKQILNFSIKENHINIYTDYQFVDYLIIFNSKKKTFDIYSIIDFELIGRSPSIPLGELVDYIISKEMDHMLILCKTENNNNKYKLYILKDSDSLILWK